MALQNATIRILTTLSSAAFVDEIPVQFNPNEYTLSRNVNYADLNIPGLETPVVQFVRGESQTLQLELFLDRSDRTGAMSVKGAPALPSPPQAVGSSSAAKGPVGIEGDLAALRLLVSIDSGLHAPPVVLFSWGTLQFQGVVASYSEKFQMFDGDGHALRARVSLTLKKYEAPQLASKRLSLQSPDRTKTRIVAEGERIDVIAVEEYGNAALWPVIAAANRLARPRVLVPGSVLLIPPL